MIKEQSLISALRYARLREMPLKDEGKNVWIMAIVAVTKTDGTKNYAIADKDKEGKIRIFKDFGNVCSVFSIDEIYPFAFLSVEYMPVFTTQKKDERIEWLYKNVEKKDYSKYSIKELNNAILNDRVTLAIRNFKKNMDYGK